MVLQLLIIALSILMLLVVPSVASLGAARSIDFDVVAPSVDSSASTKELLLRLWWWL